MDLNIPFWANYAWCGLLLVREELLLFSAVWIIVGAIDEVVMDIVWIWLRLAGRAKTGRLPEGAAEAPLAGNAAILIPAWREAAVIGVTVSHMLRAWRQSDYTIYVGCYRNDPETFAVASAAGGGDPRLRVVTVDVDGPTTKADCLNRLHAALCEDERANGTSYRSIVLQDAEDMVHPAGLAVIDARLAHADFVQLPVRPELQSDARWIAGHYADEFAESHAKDMVVRDTLGAAFPAAGVGCGFSRWLIAAFAEHRGRQGEAGPFAADCLTEDYELGLLTARLGGRSRFLRLRDDEGMLVATRCCFPDNFPTAFRQKARWVHGIAFQGWDRLGWSSRPLDNWMVLRDRRGPLAALVLTASYLLIFVEGLLRIGGWAGYPAKAPLTPAIETMLVTCLYILCWRAVFRAGFTAREYGWLEGVLSIPRTAVGNLVAIVAGRDALAAYVRSLFGGRVVWNKTEHRRHPAMSARP